jgi:hypothetical protein
MWARGAHHVGAKRGTSPCLASDAIAMTRAPRSLASCTSAPPTPPEAPGTGPCRPSRGRGSACPRRWSRSRRRSQAPRPRAGCPWQRIARRNRRVVREAAIALRAEIARLVLVGQVIGVAQPVVGDDALADAGGVHVRGRRPRSARRRPPPGCAERRWARRPRTGPPPPGLVRVGVLPVAPGDGLGIPAFARVDVGVVEPAGADL